MKRTSPPKYIIMACEVFWYWHTISTSECALIFSKMTDEVASWISVPFTCAFWDVCKFCVPLGTSVWFETNPFEPKGRLVLKRYARFNRYARFKRHACVKGYSHPRSSQKGSKDIHINFEQQLLLWTTIQRCMQCRRYVDPKGTR